MTCSPPCIRPCPPTMSSPPHSLPQPELPHGFWCSHPQSLGSPPERSRSSCGFTDPNGGRDAKSLPFIASTGLFVQLLGNLEHFLGRVIRRKGRGDAGQVMDLATLWVPVDDFQFTRRIIGQRLLTIAPDARHVLVVIWAEAIQPPVRAFG